MVDMSTAALQQAIASAVAAAMAPLVAQMKDIVQDIDDLRNAEVQIDMDTGSVFADDNSEAAEPNAASCSASTGIGSAVGHRQLGARSAKMRRLTLRPLKK